MAPGYDLLFNSLTALLVFCLVLIMGAMVYFVWKYRYRGGAHNAVEISHNTALEVAWSVIPLFVVIGLFAWGFKNYLDMVIPPKDAIEIRVTGQKWSWSFEYENGATSGNEIAVPINKPVKLIMTSNDVLHAFFIPSFRVKMDVVPKKFNTLWFQATQYGAQQVFCAEYCGAPSPEELEAAQAANEADALSAAAADYSDFAARQARRGWSGAKGLVSFHIDADFLLPTFSFVPLWVDGAGYWLIVAGEPLLNNPALVELLWGVKAAGTRFAVPAGL